MAGISNLSDWGSFVRVWNLYLIFFALYFELLGFNWCWKNTAWPQAINARYIYSSREMNKMLANSNSVGPFRSIYMNVALNAEKSNLFIMQRKCSYWMRLISSELKIWEDWQKLL